MLAIDPNHIKQLVKKKGLRRAQESIGEKKRKVQHKHATVHESTLHLPPFTTGPRNTFHLIESDPELCFM